MRKPWQIWCSFLLCLSAILLAMFWISHKTLQLDALRETDRRETELARQEAELQERISSALYRMDLKLMPLIGQEATRPHYLYQSFYHIAGSNADRNVDLPAVDTGLEYLSPLLFQPSEFVKLHFQIDAKNRFSSPQCPAGNDLLSALNAYQVRQSSIDASQEKLRNAAELFDYRSLLGRCSDSSLTQELIVASTQNQRDTLRQQSVYAIPAVEKLRDQINNNAVNGLNSTAGQDTNNKIETQRARGENRVNQEFNRRRDSTQLFANQQWANNKYGYGNGLNLTNSLVLNTNPALQNSLNQGFDGSFSVVQQGVMQPLWAGEHLVLARRIDGKNTSLVQCCWLDWESIQQALKIEVADLLPVVNFQPVRSESELKMGMSLTTLPVQLVIDSSAVLPALALDLESNARTVTGLRMSLWIAWTGLGIAAIASALLLHGVMRLSERRAAFVSAVTHELRTPLTTFRMYAEMLSEKMVPADKQQQYANTLKVQADRLSHLVENVLQFAQLERGTSQSFRETVSIGELFARFSNRLSERASDAEMNVQIDFSPSDSEMTLTTQPQVIEQIIFNLVDNACKYAKPASDNRILIQCEQTDRRLQIMVRDFGPGIDSRNRKRMFQPFCKSNHETEKTAPGVGLGLALCRRMARSLGGRLELAETTHGAQFVLDLPIDD